MSNPGIDPLAVSSSPEKSVPIITSASASGVSNHEEISHQDVRSNYPTDGFRSRSGRFSRRDPFHGWLEPRTSQQNDSSQLTNNSTVGVLQVAHQKQKPSFSKSSKCSLPDAPKRGRISHSTFSGFKIGDSDKSIINRDGPSSNGLKSRDQKNQKEIPSHKRSAEVVSVRPSSIEMIPTELEPFLNQSDRIPSAMSTPHGSHSQEPQRCRFSDHFEIPMNSEKSDKVIMYIAAGQKDELRHSSDLENKSQKRTDDECSIESDTDVASNDSEIKCKRLAQKFTSETVTSLRRDLTFGSSVRNYYFEFSR